MTTTILSIDFGVSAQPFPACGESVGGAAATACVAPACAAPLAFCGGAAAWRGGGEAVPREAVLMENGAAAGRTAELFRAAVAAIASRPLEGGAPPPAVENVRVRTDRPPIDCGETGVRFDFAGGPIDSRPAMPALSADGNFAVAAQTVVVAETGRVGVAAEVPVKTEVVAVAPAVAEFPMAGMKPEAVAAGIQPTSPERVEPVAETGARTVAAETGRVGIAAEIGVRAEGVAVAPAAVELTTAGTKPEVAAPVIQPTASTRTEASAPGPQVAAERPQGTAAERPEVAERRPVAAAEREAGRIEEAAAHAAAMMRPAVVAGAEAAPEAKVAVAGAAEIATAAFAPAAARAEAAGALVEAAGAVVEAMQVARGEAAGDGEVRVELKREVLDGSRVSIVREGGELKVAFAPATDRAERILEANAPGLAEHLAARLHAARIAVEVVRRRRR